MDKSDNWNLGTYSSTVQAGIAPAIRFREEIGTDKVHARLRELTRYWTTIARDVRGFRLHTPMHTDDLGAVSLFSIDGMDARKIEEELRNTWQVHVKRRSVQGLDGIRVSPHIYMLKNELDVFVEALMQVVKLGSA